MQEGQREISHNDLTSLRKWLAEKGFRRDSEETTFTKNYKELEILDSHAHQHPERTWHVEEDFAR